MAKTIDATIIRDAITLVLRNAPTALTTNTVTELVQACYPKAWYPTVYSSLMALARQGVVTRSPAADANWTRNPVRWRLAPRQDDLDADFDAIVAGLASCPGAGTGEG